MTAQPPRVTIGFATYNVERYLSGAFDAVLAQDYPDFEVVVCDNGSTDSTWEICQRYADKDSRFRIQRNETNLGYARNMARLVTPGPGRVLPVDRPRRSHRADPAEPLRCGAGREPTGGAGLPPRHRRSTATAR